jgi:hypothetical protein
MEEMKLSREVLENMRVIGRTIFVYKPITSPIGMTVMALTLRPVVSNFGKSCEYSHAYINGVPVEDGHTPETIYESIKNIGVSNVVYLEE